VVVTLIGYSIVAFCMLVLFKKVFGDRFFAGWLGCLASVAAISIIQNGGF